MAGQPNPKKRKFEAQKEILDEVADEVACSICKIQTNESQEKSVSSELNFEYQHTSKTTSSPTAKEICSNVMENLVSSAPLNRQNISSDEDDGWDDDIEQDSFVMIQEKIKNEPVEEKQDFHEKQSALRKPPKAFQKYRLKNQMWLRKPKIISDVENGRACPAVDEFVSLLYSEDTRIDVSFNLEKYALIIL